MGRVRAYRRVGTIDGVEVHKPPVGQEVIMNLPEAAELIDRGHIESYEDRLASDLESIGLEEQHVFVARAEDGRIQGVLVGFFVGDSIYERDDTEQIYGSVWLRDVLATHAYIDALEVYEKRQGVGRKLFQAFEKWARARGAEGVAGSPMNEGARMFDESVGMVQHPQDYKLWTKPAIVLEEEDY